MTRLANIVIAVAMTCGVYPLSIPRVSASPISYEFTVTASTGPLAGVSSIGTFTFDSSIIPSGNATVAIAGLFSHLSFTWDGVAFSAATANTGELDFNQSGVVVGAFFGTDCGPNGFGCGVTGGTHEWLFFLNSGNSGFEYATPSDPINIFFQLGGVNLAGPVGLPTPGTLPLLCIALALLGLLDWRRKKLHLRGMS